MTIDKPFTELQSQLRDSNMRSINYTNAAPMCCCEGVETVHEIKSGRLHWIWIVLGTLAVCGVLGVVW